jgi:hypothetical protein
MTGSIPLTREVAMAANRDFQPEIQTKANFLQARTAIDADGEQVVLLDYEMLEFDPSPVTVGMKCSLEDIRKLVHTCLAALDSFGDQPASVLLKVLNSNRPPRLGRRT